MNCIPDKYNRTAFGFWLLAFGFGLGFGFTACENDLARVNTITAKLDEPVETSRGVEAIVSDSARVKVVLKTPLLRSYKGKEPYQLMPKGVNIVFYDKDLQVESTLTAKYARHNEDEKRYVVRDSVVVINSKNEKLETEELIWEEETDRIYSDKFVKITTENQIIEGEGLVTNQKFDPYVIKRPTGTFKVKQSPVPADSARADTAASNQQQ